MYTESSATRAITPGAARPAGNTARALLKAGRIRAGWPGFWTAALVLCAAQAPVSAEILAGGGTTLSSRDDASASVNVTWVTGRRIVLEAGYLDDRIIDRNRFNLGPQGRRVDPYYYLALRYRWQRQSGRFRPFFGTGFMVTSEENTLFSSRLLFSHAAGLRVGNWELSLRHFSNAGLDTENEGEDLLLLQYRF